MQVQIRPMAEGEYRTLYQHMKRDFPRGELPPFFAVRGNLSSGAYEGLWFWAEDGQEVGYAVVTPPSESRYVLINFLAMHPAVRSKGFGGAALSALAERYAGRVLVLEVEDPAFSKNDQQLDIRTRRIRFYERAGFQVMPTARARIFGVDMLIMMSAAPGADSVRDIMHAMYRPTFSSDRWLRYVDVEDAE